MDRHGNGERLERRRAPPLQSVIRSNQLGLYLRVLHLDRDDLPAFNRPGLAMGSSV